MIIAVIVMTVILTLVAITVVHYFLTMPTEATHGGRSNSGTATTSKPPQVSPPATSSNPVGWVREAGAILRKVLSNVSRVMEENSNTSGGPRSLLNASLPKGITVEEILHAVVVNDSTIIIGNRTYRYVLLSYCILGQCRETEGTVSLGQYTITLQSPPKTITTTGGQLIYVLIKKENKLVDNVSHYYVPFLIDSYWVTIIMSAVNLSDNHVMYFLQVYGLPAQGFTKMFSAWLALIPTA